MRKPIGCASAALLLLASASAVALDTDAVGPAAFDVDRVSGPRLAADVDAVDAEDDAAADPAPDGEVEPTEEEAPLRRQLDDALEEIKGDGTVDDLKKKYFPSPERPDG